MSIRISNFTHEISVFYSYFIDTQKAWDETQKARAAIVFKMYEKNVKLEMT